ncbi:PepSY domain-containing protein [Streptomyces sp. CB03234]|uniref:PepSY domain-containing protein n=1 Tax=Streptomyces sp. (strain CB03234) TaxID=1703937 RepID=UPI00093CCECB|nr:PepSY domain-containing protein [Streptomyces sp. CB03234]
MKRNIVIATVTAAALLTGGTAAAFASSADDAAPSKVHHAATQVDDDRDDASDADEAQRAVQGIKVTADEALKAVANHGTVVSLDLDDDDNRKSWDVELLTKDGKVQDWDVDAQTGKAAQDTDQDD